MELEGGVVVCLWRFGSSRRHNGCVILVTSA